MSKTMMPDITTEEAMNYEEAAARMFAEMRRANEKMERDQDEIERLKQTRETLARLEAR